MNKKSPQTLPINREDLGVENKWQSWKAATRNPVEALKYE
jgi:hypothetical protein